MLSVGTDARSDFSWRLSLLVRTHGFLSSICAKRIIANDCLPIVYANFLNKRRGKEKDETNGAKREREREREINKTEKSLRDIPSRFF